MTGDFLSETCDVGSLELQRWRAKERGVRRRVGRDGEERDEER